MERIFLLGGKDLEMETIKSLLNERSESYKDNNLAWGAKWSDYDPFLESDEPGQYGTIYGIELSGGLSASVPREIREKCRLIDHHNENSSRKASILQVCEILGVNPTRTHELVAANDSRFIQGMMDIGATDDEIAKIRKMDRRLSGCSEKDEENAFCVCSIYSKKDGGTLVTSRLKSSKFAPFIDTHWKPKRTYLVYDGSSSGDMSEVQLSGDNSMEALDLFKSYCPDAWYGGGNDGFIGGYINKVKLKSLFNDILKSYGCKAV